MKSRRSQITLKSLKTESETLNIENYKLGELYTKFKNSKKKNDAIDLGLQQQLSQCIEKSI